METKDLLTYSIEEISAERLSQLRSAITDELDKRQFRAKEAAWNKLVDDFKDYTSTFGSIEVTTDEDTFYMSNLDDFSSIGEIQIIID